MQTLRRWWPLLALLALAFNLRPVAVAVGPVLAEITADIGLGPVTAGLLTSLPTMCFAIFGAVAPWVGRRLGTHRAILLAICVLILGQVGRVVVDSPAAFLTLSAIALGGMALANVLIPSLVREHFPNRVGMATALYSLTMTIGVTLASSATVPLAHALGGWRASLGTGVLTASIALLFWLPMLKGRSRRTGPAERAITFRMLARTRLAWAMAVLFGCQSAHAYTIFGWLPSVYRSAGMDEVGAGLMLGINAAVGIAPAFLIPAFIERLRSPTPLFIGIMGFLVAGYLGLMTAPMTLPWLWPALLALGTSSFPLLLALFGLRARTASSTASLSGFSQSVGYLIAMAGPMSFGMLGNATRSWDAAIAFQLALVVPMTVAGLYVCRPQMIEDHLA